MRELWCKWDQTMVTPANWRGEANWNRESSKVPVVFFFFMKYKTCTYIFVRQCDRGGKKYLCMVLSLFFFSGGEGGSKHVYAYTYFCLCACGYMVRLEIELKEVKSREKKSTIVGTCGGQRAHLHSPPQNNDRPCMHVYIKHRHPFTWKSTSYFKNNPDPPRGDGRTSRCSAHMERKC